LKKGKISIVILILTISILAILLPMVISEKNALHDKPGVDDEVLISITISQSLGNFLSYHVDLHANGILSTTVGSAYAGICWDEGSIRIKDFSPILTKHTRLSDSEMKKLEERISKINMPEDGGLMRLGVAWYISISYKEQVWYDTFNSFMYHSDVDNSMIEIVNTLIEQSPIEIVTYDLHDWDEIEYFNSLRFIQ